MNTLAKHNTHTEIEREREREREREGGREGIGVTNRHLSEKQSGCPETIRWIKWTRTHDTYGKQAVKSQV